MIIGVTGKNGSGKGTVVEHLLNKGFAQLSLSDEIRYEAKKRGIELARPELQRLGIIMRQEEGSNVLAKRALSKAEPGKNYVVDSIRNPAEVAELKKSPDFFLIAIDAPAQIRFEWLRKRNRESDPKSWEEFLETDLKEEGRDKFGNDRGESSQKVSECITTADFHILNDGDIGNLWRKTEDVFQEVLGTKESN